MAVDGETYLLEKQEWSDEESDGEGFAAVSDDDSLLASSDEEGDGSDADAAGITLASLTRRRDVGGRSGAGAGAGAGDGDGEGEAEGEQPVTAVRPSVVDDFIRNFLIRHKFSKTLDMFNTEWYEKKARGDGGEDFEPVPDLYVRNQRLSEQVTGLRVELAKNQEIAAKAQGTWDKFRKERDFHRMHHKRVMQEKNRLIVDIKRLKKHYATYEPTLEELRGKYESAMKEKMLMRLERDRTAAKVASLEAQLKSFEEAAGAAREPAAPTKTRRRKKGRDSKLPADGAVNPHLGRSYAAPEVDRFQLSKTFKGHLNAVSALAFHPKKPILATASDDMTWKMWSVPQGDLIMSGDGHKEWIAGLDFHPAGTHLATAAGDGLVKLWDFASASCAATFSDHTQAVWDCAFHHEGDFLVSCSMDHTAKLWDLSSSRCRQTFRGHVDSVNSACFQPYSNNICTGSGDKTVSLWDIRTGLCIQTLYGHNNACNNVTFNLQGDTIASCDADGVVKLWDVRMVEERLSIETGEHPVNKVALDRSGKVLACAADDSTIKLYNVEDGSSLGTLRGHNDAVQAVLFDPNGRFLVSGGSDNTFRIFTK